jgi:hypothetical protein
MTKTKLEISDEDEKTTLGDVVEHSFPKKKQPPPGTVCRFFLQGKCWAGAQCRWIHPPSLVSRSIIVNTPVGPMLVHLPHNAISAQYDEALGVIVANVIDKMDVKGPPQLCFYFRQGRCRYGDDCRYTHDAQSHNMFRET